MGNHAASSRQTRINHRSSGQHPVAATHGPVLRLLNIVLLVSARLCQAQPPESGSGGSGKSSWRTKQNCQDLVASVRVMMLADLRMPAVSEDRKSTRLNSSH